MHSKRYKEYVLLKQLIDDLYDILNKLFKQTIYNIDNKSHELLSDIKEELEFSKKSLDELQNPFLIFIVGSGNYGKSTLINSLLGKKIIKTSDLPNTWKLDLYIRSDDEKVEIMYRDNSIQTVNFLEAKNILQKEEVRFKNSKKEIHNKVMEYKKKSSSMDEVRRYKKELEDACLYKSSIEEVRHYINVDGILQDFIIVDTPGLNQNLIKNTMERMISYYKRSDGILMMMDAQNIIAKSTNDILDEIRYLEANYGKSNKMIAVVNKMDIITKCKEENANKVINRINEIYKTEFNEIVFVSAKEALEGIINNDNNMVLKSNIKTLHNSIDINFKEKSENLQIKAKYKTLLIAKDNILSKIDIYKRELYRDFSKYNEVDYEVETKINRIVNYAKSMLSKIPIKENKYINKELTEKKVADIERVINEEIEKLYLYFFDVATINKKDIECINIDKVTIKFKTHKYVNRKYNYTSSILPKELCNYFNFNDFFVSTKKSYKNIKDLEIYKSDIKQWELFKKDSLYIIKEKLELFMKDIHNYKQVSFKKKYLDYNIIKEHIYYLDSIESILKDLG